MSPLVSEDNRQGWVLAAGEVAYERALNWQRELVRLRLSGMARDTMVLLEHPPVITIGRDGHEENYPKTDITPIHIERGGDVTYHGPGQLVVYFIFNLTRRGRDLHKFMDDIQTGVIETLAEFGQVGKTSEENTGVWIGKKKIASVGIAVKQWISYHGVAFNINTDLKQFRSINPCGLQADVMTSLQELTGRPIEMKKIEKILIEKYSAIFDTTFTPLDLEMLAEDVESNDGSNVI